MEHKSLRILLAGSTLVSLCIATETTSDNKNIELIHFGGAFGMLNTIDK